MAAFPSYACILLADYTEETDYGVLRTEMDGGIARQRARWTKPIRRRKCQIKVSSIADKINFDSWVLDDLNGGVSWFDYTDPLDGLTKQARIVGGKLSWSSPGVVWFAQTELETLE